MEENLKPSQRLKLTKSYRMLCSFFGLKKKDANQIVAMFETGGYSISKSRVMNLLSQDESMTVEELHAFITGIKMAFEKNTHLN